MMANRAAKSHADDLEQKDRLAVAMVDDYQGLAELLAHSCSMLWAGIVVDVQSASPMWVSYGAGSSALGRSPHLWNIGFQAREIVVLREGEGRVAGELKSLRGAESCRTLVVAPLLQSDGTCVAFAWLADRRDRDISAAQRRCLELICSEILLRRELRSRLAEKLQLIEDLRKTHEELRNLNRQLVLARDRALEGERAKAVFLTNLSHELRTPLNAVLGFTELALEDAREKSLENLVVPLEHVLEAGRRLTEMIENILRMARLETKRMPLSLESFDLAQLLSEVVEAVRPLAANHNNELSLTLSPNLGAIYADRGKTRQIIYNILVNACKFTRDGKVSVASTRVASPHWENVRIVVADTGAGMTRAQLESLLEKMSADSDSSAFAQGSYGVGLAVANRFCKLMGGSIRVTSRPHAGTRFLVTLPTRVEVSEESPMPSSGILKAVSSVGPPPPDDAPIVLVVEADPQTSDLLATSLRRGGYRVVVAATPEEALQYTEKQAPDAIVLDVNLGNNDGWALLARLRTLPLVVERPIILLTETVDQNLAFELGATDVISKPVSPAQFVQILRRWVAQAPRSNSENAKGKKQ